MTRVAATPALARLRGQFAATAPTRVILHRGTCSDAARADGEWHILRAALGSALVEGACDGACWAAPAATVQREGHQHRFADLGDPVPEELMRCLAGDCDDEYAGRGVFGILERLGRQDGTIGDAVRRGAYAAFAQASAIGPERTMDAMRNSTYASRYPAPALHEGSPISVVAETDGPTDVIDRHLLEGDSHRVLEGVLVACRANSATRALLALGGQPVAARAALAGAIDHAAREGILDGSALGGAAIEVEVIDASPRDDGVTIEAACALTTVFDRPPPPTRLVALSGAVPRPGVYEVPLGGATTWTGILATAGVTPGLVPGLRVGGKIVARDAFEDVVTPSALGRGAVEVLAEA
jgi:hypothetical protein